MHRRTFLARAAALPAAALATRLDAMSLLAPPISDSATDIAVVRAAMTMHPGLHLHRSPREVAAAQARFEADYAAAPDLAAAYLTLSRFLTKLRCGHSYANFFNQDDPAVLTLFDRPRPTRLPFWFRWIGERMIVLRDPSPMQLPRGTEVLELNGRRARDLLAALMPYTRADGSNDAKRRSLLSVEGNQGIETFDVFQGLLLPPPGGVHRLLVRTPDGRTRRAEAAPITLAARRAMETKVSAEGDQPRWQWRQRPDGIAVLTMPGWAMWNCKWDWRSWLEERLDSLADARGLIVDIRDNEGGDDCGDPILARLVDRPVSGWPFDSRIRFNTVPPLIRQHSSTWDNSFYALGDGAAPLGNGFFRPREKESFAFITPSTKRITCPVVALTSPVNSSATFGFINAARETGTITLIGEATGGNRRGINGGNFLFAKLPGSGIEFDLPLKGYVARRPAPDAGIEPEIHVPVTVASLRSGTDETLARAVRHCLSRG